MKKLFILFIAVAGFGVSSYAQVVTQNGTSSAKLISPITIAATRANLEFGILAKGLSDGTVVIAPTAAGARTSTNVDLVGTPTNNSAIFTATHEDASQITWGFPSPTVDLISGSDHLTVTLSNSGLSGSATGTSDIIYVGGSLAVPSTAAAGTYSGTFAITAAYN